MAETGMSKDYYLQVHPNVECDPRIASLPPSLRDLFLRIRLMSLQNDPPGEINLSWAALLRCLGVKSERRQERVAQLFITDNRLLSRGSKDGQEFVSIARWTMPQLTRPSRDQARETTTPRPRYPSDERRKERQPERDTTPEPSLADSFFNAPNALAESAAESVAESAQTPPKQSGVPNNKKEKAEQSKADSATPQAALTPEQIVVVVSLQAEGMHPPTAERLVKELVKQGKPLSLVETEINSLDSRNVRQNRAGLLRRAVEALLNGHPYQAPNRHKPAPSRRKITPHPPARPAEPGEAPPMTLLRGAMKSSGAAASAPAS